MESAGWKNPAFLQCGILVCTLMLCSGKIAGEIQPDDFEYYKVLNSGLYRDYFLQFAQQNWNG